MKVVHISATDGEGGAARAAYRLHSGLRDAGHDSRMLVKTKTSCDPSVDVFRSGWPASRRALGWLQARTIERAIKKYWPSRPADVRPFSDDRSRFGSAFSAAIPECDIVHLHWLGTDFFDYRAFFEQFPGRTPVVWTLHDMAPFTGGCHYDEACGRYRQACGCCPVLGSNDEDDLSRQIFLRKQNAFSGIPRKANFQTVVVSHWMYDMTNKSPLLGEFPVNRIPYWINTEFFQPRECRGVSRALGVETGEKMVLFVAENPASRRKGMVLFLDAMQIVARQVPGVKLVCVGKSQKLPESAGPPVVQLGAVWDERLLGLIYSAATVFVIPSLQEAFGLTALEAMACGTPVIGFDAGGIPDIVRPGKTGSLAPVGDVQGLAEKIKQLLQDDATRQKMSGQCRSIVLSEYTLRQQVSEHVKLYERMSAWCAR